MKEQLKLSLLTVLHRRCDGSASSLRRHCYITIIPYLLEDYMR